MIGDSQLQEYIEAICRVPALRIMLGDGLQRTIGRVPKSGEHLMFPVPPPLRPVRRPPDPPQATIVERTIEVTVPRYVGSDRQPSLSALLDLRGRLDDVHENLVSELLGGPYKPPSSLAAVDPIAYPGNSLTLDKLLQMQRDLIAQMAIPSSLGTPDPGMSGSGFALSQLAARYGHVNEPLVGYQLRDRFHDQLLHRRGGCGDRGCNLASMPSVVERAMKFVHRSPFGKDNGCPLCGELRDPDVEPVELNDLPDLPAGTEVLIGREKVPIRLPIRRPNVTACSAACATAYAIKCSPLRERTPIALALEQRHQEREAAAARLRVNRENKWHDVVTDSEMTGFDLMTLERKVPPRNDIWGSSK